MAAPTSILDLQASSIGTNAWRTRTLSIVLLLVIAGVFWGDSRYPALMKRYHAGSQIKASGALTFGTVYAVDRGMPLPTRVWRTTINWLDANRVGMTFAFLRARRANFSGNDSAPAFNLTLFERAVRRGGRHAAGGLYQLRGPNRAWILRLGTGHRIGSRRHVCFARA